MNVQIKYKLNTNPNYIRFLRENSNWYKYLNRNPLYFKEFEREMKLKYKLTTEDKINNFTKNLDRISKIIDIFS